MSLFDNGLEYKLLKAIEDEDISKINSILNNQYESFNLNFYENSFLSIAVKTGNLKIVKLILEYANNKNINLKINEKVEDGNYLLLLSAKYNNLEVVNLLIEQATINKTILKINEKNNENFTSLLLAIKNNNIEMVRSLIKYANENDIILDLSENSKGIYPIFYAVENDNSKMVKLLMEYAKSKNITLKVNKSMSNGYYPLLIAYQNGNLEIAKLLMQYADENRILLKINKYEKNNKYYPLLFAVENNDNEMFTLLLEYAINHNIILKINAKNKSNYYPLFGIIKNNNIDMFKQMIDLSQYSKKSLYINEKFNEKYYPLLYAIENHQTEIIELMGDYAYENDIALMLMEGDINNINKIDDEILELLYKFFDKDILNITFKNHSKLYKIFKRIGKYLDDFSSVASDSSEDSIEVTEVNRNTTRKPPLFTDFDTENLCGCSNTSRGILCNINDVNNISKQDNDEKIIVKDDENKTSDLAITLYDFESRRPEEISIDKNEYVIVTNWNVSEGWIYGYKRDHPEQKGIFPYFIIHRCIDETKYIGSGDLAVVLYNFNGIKFNELDVKMDDRIRVLDWNIQDGWVYGYKVDTPQKKGIIPKPFIQKLEKFDDGNNNNNNDIPDALPSYEEVIKYL